MIKTPWKDTHATCAELCAIFGPRWAICRDTPSNRERYGRCVTDKEYERAQIDALANRAANGQT